MAKFLFSALLTDARGKFGNAVFSANKSGRYIRENFIPANPNTALQNAVRTSFGSVASGWRGLTDAQRLAWQQATSEFIQKDVFGENVQLSGAQLYSKLNNSLMQAGLPTIDTPPAMPIWPELNDFAVISDEFGLGVGILVGAGVAYPAGYTAVVKTTGQLSAGIMSVPESKLRVLQILPASGVAEDYYPNVLYKAKYGNYQVGSSVFVRLEIVHNASGLRQIYEGRVTLVAQTQPD